MSDRSPTIYLHIGPPKTGTSYIQDTLRAWHDELSAAGILYPINPERIHFFAALDARGKLGYGIEVGDEQVERTQAAGAWGRLTTAVRAFDGTSIISHEVFATADDEHAQAAVRDLADTDLHLIVTARDPARQLASAWQQRVRQGSTRAFATVASSVRHRKSLSHSQDLPGLLDRWGRDLEPDHVHVVTVPPAGSEPTLLWERFSQIVGIDPTRFDTSRTKRVNDALSWAEAETLRRVNDALDGRIPHPRYYEIVGQFFAREIIKGSSKTSKAMLPPDMGPLADEIAQRWIDVIESKGYDVVGNLADLRPQTADSETSRPNEAAIAQVAVKANAELLVELARRDGDGDRTGALRRSVSRARRRVLGSRRPH